MASLFSLCNYGTVATEIHQIVLERCLIFGPITRRNQSVTQHASALGEIHRRQAPEIFALVNCKEVEYHQGPGRDKDRRLSIGSTAFWKDSIFERNT